MDKIPKTVIARRNTVISDYTTPYLTIRGERGTEIVQLSLVTTLRTEFERLSIKKYCA